MMRYFSVFLTCLNVLFGEHFIAYDFSGGRFGDCLISYMHAKWLSYKFQMPLLYKSFEYSSDLKLDDLECRYPVEVFHLVIKLSKYQPFPQATSRAWSCIYVCPYFAEDPSDRWLNPLDYRFDVNWKDPKFRNMLQEMIAPKRALVLTVPSRHTVNIAIHIREGGGFDTDHTRLYAPLKLPPLLFYIEGIKQVVELFRERPIYCHVFTDALNPALLVLELEKSFPPGLSIRCETRQDNNHHSLNVLEDFFSFFEFDVLIRPQSNYSIAASCIRDFAVVFSPYNFIRENGRITITETTMDVNEDLYQQVLKRTEMCAH